MPRIILFIMCVMLVGCAASTAVGSKTWHEARLMELSEAHQAGEITTEKYLELKNDTDKIRLEYGNQRSRDLYYSSYYSRSHIGYGFGYCHPACH